KPLDELVGACGYDIGIAPPDIVKFRKAQIGKVVRAGKPIRFEDEREGIIFDTSIYPVFDARGKVTRLAIFGRDITERKQQELQYKMRAQLLDKLRSAKTIDDCLQLGCQAIRDAGLFERAVLTLNNEKFVITHLGQVGLDPKIVKQARNASPPDDDLRKRMMQKEFQISHSFFIPQEATVDFARTSRYVPQQKGQSTTNNSWKPGDELFVPIIGKEGSTEGYLSADTPMNGKRPDRESILFLEDIVDIVARQTHEIQNMMNLQKSEEKFRTLSEEIADGVAVTVDGKYYWVNQAFSEIFGYTKEELIGRGVDFLIVPEEIPSLTQRMKNRLAGKQVLSRYESVAKRKNGKRIDIAVSAKKIIFEDKQAIQLVIRDITERKQAEQTNRRLAEIVRNASDGVVLTDPLGRTLYVNPAFEKMNGHVQSELLDQDPVDLIVTDDKTAIANEIRTAVRTKDEWAGDLLCRRKSGEIYPIESRVF
ncbi:PAS domain S-box protein, partial [bacterium]|nr:PAS domain S-box protein [bacterium]